MKGIQSFCTPTAEVFEGVRLSGDGRTNPNKLSWQVHEYVEQFRPYKQGEVLSPDFTGWLMGFPSGWVEFSIGMPYYSLLKEC